MMVAQDTAGSDTGCGVPAQPQPTAMADALGKFRRCNQKVLGQNLPTLKPPSQRWGKEAVVGWSKGVSTWPPLPVLLVSAPHPGQAEGAAGDGSASTW